MPSLNVVDYIDECMQSALNQTLIEKQIICVDAGSTDGTWEKLSQYARDPKYRDQIVQLHSDVRSYGYQVNLGIHEAIGEYVAVLETDDYVEANMYRRLYESAIVCQADYVKADYDTFVTYFGNRRIFDTVKLFYKEKEKYGEIINPSGISYLYASDYNIWKGIYNRDFLIRNDITLNESKGAAFQDIGFAQQVLACAQRAVYCEESFYRYRMDREQSSINSVHGLEYSQQEFARLLDTDKLKEKIVCMDGVFRHMAQSFYGELMKTLRAVGYDVDSEFIKPYYEWFKERLTNAIESQSLGIDLYSIYPQLSLILEDIDMFCMQIKEKDLLMSRKREHFLESMGKKPVVVFGVGAYGKAAIKFLFENEIKIYAACDNNERFWNLEIYGTKIYSPEKCVKMFSDAMYIIANKRSHAQIGKQLHELGIGAKNILIYPAI